MHLGAHRWTRWCLLLLGFLMLVAPAPAHPVSNVARHHTTGTVVAASLDPCSLGETHGDGHPDCDHAAGDPCGVTWRGMQTVAGRHQIDSSTVASLRADPPCSSPSRIPGISLPLLQVWRR